MRRWNAHVAMMHIRGRTPCLSFCHYSPMRYANACLVPCGCSRHPRGRPKYGTGACFHGMLRPAVKQRREGRTLCQRWMAGKAREEEG